METTMIQTPEFERIQTTDPREAKLKDIIEKGRASLHKALKEIQHEFAIREDMAVRPTAIDFLVRDLKIQLVIREEAYDLTCKLKEEFEGRSEPNDLPTDQNRTERSL